MSSRPHFEAVTPVHLNRLEFSNPLSIMPEGGYKKSLVIIVSYDDIGYSHQCMSLNLVATSAL